ncbi:hypothetical protein [Photorhabdus australis]|uniref:hypothetical protein n=1 Tax=Photorhabdus australis TaxID=286156 RepID=UPI00191BDDDF|nr:hypothetical protein [Photorhabdus australis]
MPVMIVSDWSGFLTPVSELMIDAPEPQIYYHPENCSQSENEKPFVLVIIYLRLGSILITPCKGRYLCSLAIYGKTMVNQRRLFTGTQ